MIDGTWYHSLPATVSAVAFHLGPVTVYWYSLMWIVGFGMVYALLRARLRRGEASHGVEMIDDAVLWAFVGALVGGRLGYVVLYDLAYYAAHPLSIISPYDPATGTWTGIYGMSYHGGALGALVGLWYVARRYRADVVRLLDFVAPAIPAGYFFGRLGNFFNHELVGRVTTSPVGMYFSDERVLRHPSQLYEAATEGLVLFAVLWILRNRLPTRGALTTVYVVGYAVARFLCEFFREPDAHIGVWWEWMTRGHALSVVMFCGGIIFFVVLRRLSTAPPRA